ncbi:hypothetical protein GJAV_G00109180 [Gymnothorax javanicus]|nr:hypothetical protein GJAV_G00109180 [Gymnothorax javanicus]
MDRGGCRLSGGGGGDGQRRGVIRLEDLASFTEEQLPVGDGGVEENSEAIEEERQDILLNYWQDIGSVHQVSVPRVWGWDEKRRYNKANWACVTVQADTYEQSICLGFMKLMRYICQHNTLGLIGMYLGMTIPIVTVVRTDESRTVLSRDVIVAYHLPSQHQAQPPLPLDPDIAMQEWPSSVVYSRSFSGVTNERCIIYEQNTLAEVLGSLETPLRNYFIIAGYTSPAAAIRNSEVWFLERQ